MLEWQSYSTGDPRGSIHIIRTTNMAMSHVEDANSRSTDRVIEDLPLPFLCSCITPKSCFCTTGAQAATATIKGQSTVFV